MWSVKISLIWICLARVYCAFQLVADSPADRPLRHVVVLHIWPNLQQFAKLVSSRSHQKLRTQSCNRKFSFYYYLAIGVSPTRKLFLSVYFHFACVCEFVHPSVRLSLWYPDLNRKYSIERRTVATNVPYYVTENFHEYQGSLGRLEANVEEDYKGNLRYNCDRERIYSKYFWKQLTFHV